MDEISKQASPRVSVSMPSLEAVDDLPDETSLPALPNENDFASSSTTESVIASTDVLASESGSFTSVEAAVDPKQIIEPASISEESSQNAQLDDSQAEDDPSIAIDQFIKKIADEQLSSKRSVSEDLDQPDKVSDKELTENDEGSAENEISKTASEPIPMELEVPEAPEVNKTAEAENAPETTNSDDKMDIEPEVAPELEKEPDESISKPENVTTKSDLMKEIKMEVKEREVIMTNDFEDSSEVSRDPFLLAKAQEDMKKLDVLICGSCHDAFHFVEEFQEHKVGKCSGLSSIVNICEMENKPQIWGFNLWKARQIKELGDSAPSGWSIYQKWCRLSDHDKNAWITAGQSIQFASKIANAKIIETRNHHATEVESDPLEHVDSNKENSEVPGSDNDTSNVIRRGIVKPVKLNNDVTILPSTKNNDPNSNKAIRTTKILSTQKQEYVVEQILAKRFNPRRKTWEYQIKWENFPSESNTWEPLANLNHCKQMLEQFEERLKKVKEEKAKQAATGTPKGRGRPPRIMKQVTTTQYVPIAPKLTSTSSSSGDFTPGRPQRNSKQKAINHMKAWCGSISDDEGSGGVKRAHEDDDSDVDFEKKLKLEDYSDDSDLDIKPKIQARKTTVTPKPQIQIGPGKTVIPAGAQQILPSNILIPDANGVVRINQKQLPALSSGVYIMSKTAGIIKLDSTTSKVATSGGQTIVKVAPKVGQTQIKIVKKDGNLTKQIIQVSPKADNLSMSPLMSGVNKSVAPKTYRAVSKVKKEQPQTPKVTIKPKVEVKKPSTPPSRVFDDEESDDGLEPLEFPDDFPVPEPESPPGEFTLDPITGKVAGQEYGEDKPVVIKEEPAISATPSTNELENIVKLAAADITEDDLHNANSQDIEELDPLAPDVEIKQSVKVEPVSLIRYVVKNTATTPSVVKKDGSLLNKALTGQTVQKTSAPSVVKQRIVQSKASGMTPQRNTPTATRTIVRQVPMGMQAQQQGNIVRTRVVTPKPKFNVASNSTVGNKIQPSQWSEKVQVYSNKVQSPQVGAVRRVGNTIIRTQTVNTKLSPQKPKYVYRATPKKETILMSPKASIGKPKAVINMPSLLGDEESSNSKLTSKQSSSSSFTSGSRSTLKSVSSESSESALTLAEESKTADNVASTSDGVATADLSTFTMADSENPIYITGDDGTVYQVAGQNEQGQTILITQGADGQQQCLLVTNEVAETPTEEATDEPESVLGMPEMSPEEAAAPLATTPPPEESIKTPLQIKTDSSETEETPLESNQDQVVAQVVRAEPPSPGGTHKVVVMLPDGNLMVTQVSPEEYASLELE